MSTIRGTYKDGKIVLDSPPDWPDGTEVLVWPADELDAVERQDNDDPIAPNPIVVLDAPGPPESPR